MVVTKKTLTIKIEKAIKTIFESFLVCFKFELNKSRGIPIAIAPKELISPTSLLILIFNPAKLIKYNNSATNKPDN